MNTTQGALLQSSEWVQVTVGRTPMLRHKCGSICIVAFCGRCEMDLPDFPGGPATFVLTA
jgi:hypothetical protein